MRKVGERKDEERGDWEREVQRYGGIKGRA